MQIVVSIIIFSLVFVVSSHERAHYPLCVHFNDNIFSRICSYI